MSGARIDLFLGGDLGLWVLGEVSPGEVHQVFSLDSEIVDAAKTRGFRVVTKGANDAGAAPGDTGLSVHYPVIFRPTFLANYRIVYNLHPGYLPWGRGYYPIFWALWEGTPAGATLHEVTAGVDEGPVVAQTPVTPHPSDTGEDLFRKVRKAEKDLFQKYWPRILRDETLPATPQAEGGTKHSKREFFQLKQQAPWMDMRGQDFVRLVRALTFSGFTGLEIDIGGERFDLRLERLEGEERGEHDGRR